MLVKNELILYVFSLTSHKKFVSIHTAVSVILEVVRSANSNICSFEIAHRFRLLLKFDLSAVCYISFAISQLNNQGRIQDFPQEGVHL